MKTIIIWIYAVILCASNVCYSQDIYQVNWKKELPYLTTGAVSMGAGIYLKSQTSIYNDIEINKLDKNSINSFDRSTTGFNSMSAHKASNIFWHGSQALPILFLADKKGRENIVHIAALYGETVLINAGLTALTKYAVQRTRPFVYNPEADFDRKLHTNARTSFFSGHTSMTAASTFFTAKVFSDLYPDSKWKPAVWGLAAAIPAATGYLRVRAGKHFPTDVIVGYAVGASVGLLVPHFHLAHKGGKIKTEGKKNLSFYGGLNGMFVSYRF